MTLLYIGCAWILGIVLAAWFKPPWPAVVVFLPGSLIGLFLVRRHPQRRRWMWSMLFMGLGALRYTCAIPTIDEQHVAYYNGRPGVVLEGVVSAEPDVRDRVTNLRVTARRLQIDGDWRPVSGLVLVQAGRYPDWHYGDVVQARGALEIPPVFESFSYREYLARQGIHTLMRRPSIHKVGSQIPQPLKPSRYLGYVFDHVWHLDENQLNPVLMAVLPLKARAKRVIVELFPEPEASLLTGILLGYERGIPQRVKGAFSATNTSHVIAISGFNITLLAGILTHLFGRVLGRRQTTLAVIAGISLYTVLVGADAAVVRAALMGILYVIAIHNRRRSDAVVSLTVAAMCMTLYNPYALWDVGFQLSFAATLGLILLVPPLQEQFERGLARVVPQYYARRIVASLNEVLIVTLAAQIATMPLMVYYFQNLSLVGLLANLAILPAQPPVMLLGGAAVVAGLIFQPLGQGLAWLALPFPMYTIRVVELMARLPYAALALEKVGLTWVGGYYGLLVGGLVFAHLGVDRRRTLWHGLTDRLSTKALLAGLALVAVVAWMGASATPDGWLHVTFLDVGQGDAIFIETPGGNQAIIDGGPSPSTMADAVGRHMPFWDRTIELVVLTHADEDHVGGLIPILERYGVAHAIEPGYPHVATPYLRWRDLLKEQRIDTHFARAGMRIHLGDGVWLEVLNPPEPLWQGTQADVNNNGVVLRLVYGNVSFLLTGDIEWEAETWLAARQRVQAQVLKLAHHGSDTSTTTAFLAAVRPWVAVISVGSDNRFGHPSEAVLERVEALGIPLYRTDQHGEVTFVTDGRRLWVRTAR